MKVPCVIRSTKGTCMCGSICSSWYGNDGVVVRKVLRRSQQPTTLNRVQQLDQGHLRKFKIFHYSVLCGAHRVDLAYETYVVADISGT